MNRMIRCRRVRWTLPRLLMLTCLCASGVLAHADESGGRGVGVFVEAARTRHHADVAGVGVQWPWSWRAQHWGGEFSGATELSVHAWRGHDASGGRRNDAQAAVAPVLRWRPAGGRSAWFIEGGIGLALNSRPFVTGDTETSTRWNFQDTLAVGLSFGEDRRRHELSVRVIHMSNAGIRNPNPGEELLMLRWMTRF